jgi:hypothetical protein
MTRSLATLVLGLLICTTGITRDYSDVTEDGLVRVPSTRKAGVYRAPDVKFDHYQRVMLSPALVAFSKNSGNDSTAKIGSAIKQRPKPSERERISNDLMKYFHDELVAELIERGGFILVDEPGPDVIRVDPIIADLDITAPDAGTTPGARSFVRNAGSMTLIVNLYDATANVPIARVIDYEKGREFHNLQIADQVTNAEEARVAFANVARYTRSAINVAKTDRK